MTRSRLRIGVFVPCMVEPHTGVHRYMVEYIHALSLLPEGPEVVLLRRTGLGPIATVSGESVTVMEDSQLGCLVRVGDMAAKVVGHRLSLIVFGSLLTPLAARRLGLDFIHDLTGLAPFIFGSGSARSVITVHDMISWSWPGSNDFVDDAIQYHWLPRFVPKVDAVITYSSAAREDIIRYLAIARDKVHAVYLGVDRAYRPLPADVVEETCLRYNLTKGYILFVGPSTRRKNLRGVIHACARLWETGEQRPLVVVGSLPKEHTRIQELIRRLGVEQHMIFTGYVPESHLPDIYNAADLFVYPSYYEGFGLPVVEAMACGTATVCSNTSSLPEVAGDAAVMVDPHDFNALADAIQQLLADEDLRESNVRKGLSWTKSFSWERTAREGTTVYRRLLGGAISGQAAV